VLSLLATGLGARRAALIVGAVVALQTSAFVGAPSANASTCSFVGGILTVTLTGGDDPTFGVAANGDAITVDVCSPGAATVSTTISIVVAGDSGDNTVTIDMSNGPFTGIAWSLAGGGGSDNLVILGSAADDVVDVGASGVDLDGDGAIDIFSLATIASGTGSLAIDGGGGDDALTAYGSRVTGAPYAKPVTINGNAGNDDVAGGSAADELDGGAGTFDFVDYLRFGAAVTVDLATPAVSGGGGTDAITGFENIVGSRGNDVLTGRDLEDNDITGGPGNDTIDCVGGSAGDFVDFFDAARPVAVRVAAGAATGDGTDTFTNCPSVYGSANDDTIAGSGVSNDLQGAGGNDVIAGLGGNDHLAGLAGRDWVDYGWARSPVVVSLNCQGNVGAGTIASGPDATTDVIDSMEKAILTSGDDTFFGNEFSNSVRPNGGRNTLDGDGDPAVCGAVASPSGADTLDYSIGYAAGVTIDIATGDTAGDTATGFENVKGTAFADDITGDVRSNTLKVGKGDDTVTGGGGDDTLNLGPGRDTGRGAGGGDELLGHGGSDSLLGGRGRDLGNGGPGNDVCKRVEVTRSCGTARRPR
jgi:Ca2+-binding RTX toxin-like protein